MRQQPTPASAPTPASPPAPEAAPATPPIAVVRRTVHLLPHARTTPFSRQELARADAVSSSRAREDYLAAHILVRLCAARYLGVPANTLVVRQECPHCAADDHGRPFLPDHPGVGISLSHTRGAVAAAAGEGPVGVDIEEITAVRFDPRLARRVLGDRELSTVLGSADPRRAFLRHWVRKECLVKVGSTALGGLRESDVGPLGTGAGPGTGPAAGPDGGGSAGGWRFRDWADPAGTLLAAVVARTPPTFTELSARAPGPATGTAPVPATGTATGTATRTVTVTTSPRRQPPPTRTREEEHMPDHPRPADTPARPAARTATPRRFLMCRPEHFGVSYSINPWMRPEKPVDTSLAVSQWEGLRGLYRELGHTVVEIDPLPGLPDMVFAANGATVVDGRVLGARFRHAERTAEGPAYLEWFRSQGYRELHWPEFINEGEGDILTVGRRLLAGTGFRTDSLSHHEAQEFFGLPVTTLRLVNPDYYHLDTAIAVLSDTEVMYYPAAFSEGSRSVLRELFPDAILASDEDAAVFGLNALSDGRHVLLPEAAVGLARQLRARGFEPVGVDLTELLKAGGSVKCCTLELRD